MSVQDLYARAARIASPALTPVRAIAPLLTRLVLGETFVLTGLGKWRNFSNTTDFFAGLGIPVPAANAALVATVELVGGACLVLGLGTRVAALLLSSTMVVALITADRAALLNALSFSGETGLTDVVPLVYGMFLLWLIGFGAGPISADGMLAHRRRGANAHAHPYGGGADVAGGSA